MEAVERELDNLRYILKAHSSDIADELDVKYKRKRRKDSFWVFVLRNLLLFALVWARKKPLCSGVFICNLLIELMHRNVERINLLKYV